MKNLESKKTLSVADLAKLLTKLIELGFIVIGPKVKDDAIILDQIMGIDELACGYQDRQKAGSYTLEKTAQPTFFGYAVGPHSIKNILHPSQRRIWQAYKNDDTSFSIVKESLPEQKIALVGIRSCDIEAIKVLDRVFLKSGFINDHYKALRDNLLIISATCSKPSSVCFCTSMGHGPRPDSFDINLTEIYQDNNPIFVAHSRSEKGFTILKSLDFTNTTSDECDEEEKIYQNAVKNITKTMPTQNLAQFLSTTYNYAHWDEVASRCLACGNCTMVCPTCFCTTVTDHSDLTGSHSERWLWWDSCYTNDFSYIHGGSVRKTIKSRYRQWLTHKLSTWHEQFGTSGCVGCGRCIVWCPVAIDITEEVKALQKEGADCEKHCPSTG